jgi:hypothetical protein
LANRKSFFGVLRARIARAIPCEPLLSRLANTPDDPIGARTFASDLLTQQTLRFALFHFFDCQVISKHSPAFPFCDVFYLPWSLFLFSFDDSFSSLHFMTEIFFESCTARVE